MGFYLRTDIDINKDINKDTLATLFANGFIRALQPVIQSQQSPQSVAQP